MVYLQECFLACKRMLLRASGPPRIMLGVSWNANSNSLMLMSPDVSFQPVGGLAGVHWHADGVVGGNSCLLGCLHLWLLQRFQLCMQCCHLSLETDHLSLWNAQSQWICQTDNPLWQIDWPPGVHQGDIDPRAPHSTPGGTPGLASTVAGSATSLTRTVTGGTLSQLFPPLTRPRWRHQSPSMWGKQLTQESPDDLKETPVPRGETTGAAFPEDCVDLTVVAETPVPGGNTTDAASAEDCVEAATGLERCAGDSSLEMSRKYKRSEVCLLRQLNRYRKMSCF